MKHLSFWLASAALLVACGKPQPTPNIDDGARSSLSIYAAAVASPDRLDDDYARDVGRKPAEVLEFFGVGRGDTVLDMFSGGGYYTDLLAHVVGPEGRVVAQTNEAYRNFAGEEFENRHAEGRRPNVEVLVAENNELELAASEYDVIMLVLSYHDFYYVNADGGWPEIDVDRILAEFHKGLKPGGILGIVDHAAPEGSPRETGNTVHRIDPTIVTAEMLAAGFELEATSDILRNTDDDYARNVFDADLRGKTDRFVMRFVKSER